MEKPCNDCGIRGLYDNCEEECIMYRKWTIYRDISAEARKKVIDEFVKTLEKRQTYGVNEFEMGLDFTDILEVAEQLKENDIEINRGN